MKKIAYYSNSYSLEGLKNFYSACVRQVEKGEKSWSSDFSHLEQPILSKHLLPTNRSASSLTKKKFSSGGFHKSKQDDGTDKLWYCSLFNRNKCSHKSDHTMVSDNGQMKYALHICAACWQADKKKLPHAKCSKDCPHSVSKCWDKIAAHSYLQDIFYPSFLQNQSFFKTPQTKMGILSAQSYNL